MLSRTADHLYWMARYIERAENMARVLDVTYRMSLVANSAYDEAARWKPPVQIADDVEAFEQNYSGYTAANVIQFMALDERNPSSIVSALGAARENARAVRVAMSSEMWETVNALWLELRQRIRLGLNEADISEFCDWVKSRSHLFRGVTFGTMLRDDSYKFVRLGSFVERADNTARLVDVKFHAVESDYYGTANGKEQEYDFYHWSAILRSVSGFEVYRKVYRDVIRPERVAELLILRPDMPRSLHASLNEVVNNLKMVANDQSEETQRRAGKLRAELQYGRIDEILATGLHAFLTQFLDRVNELGGRISQDFLVPTVH